MYQLFIKIIFSLTLTLTFLAGHTQDTGTFKVSKKKPEETKSKYKPYGFYIGLNSTIDGKSSPERIRSYNLNFGVPTYFLAHYMVVVGVVTGKSHPSNKYQGITVGAFTKINYQMAIGPGVVYFPLEISYKKLINNLDYGNLNQYSIAAGISIPIYTIKGLYLTFQGTYDYETNSTDTYKGIYPICKIDFWF